MSTMNKAIFMLLAMIAICLTASTVARADTVVLSENFNGDAGGNYFAGTTVGQFLVQSGAVEVLASGNDTTGRCARAGGGVNCINLDGALPGSTFTSTTFVSTNFFGAGTYDLFFDLAGAQVENPPLTTFLFFGDVINSPIVRAEDDGFATFSFLGVTIAPGTQSRITFFQPGAGGFGNLLDNVRLVRRDAAAPIPEPATMTLLITGLAGVGAAMRKRRKAEQGV